MIKMFFATIALMGMAQVASAATCTTSSRGYNFSESSNDRYTAQDRVIQSCQNNRYTDANDCNRNVRCSVASYPPIGRGQISAQQQYCQSSQLCTFNISWSAGNRGSSTVVTVEPVNQGGGQKLFACGGSSGQQGADWISKGQRYIFRMYESSDCYAQVWNWMAPSAKVDFTGPR